MATVYISPTGDDSRTYATAQNISTPWLTPGKVYSSATAGDTAICLNGTYTISADITASKNITWQAQANGSVIWDDNNASHQIIMETNGVTTSFTGIKFYRWKFKAQNQCAPFRIAGNAVGGTQTVTFALCVFDTITVKDNGSLGIGGVFACGQNNASMTVTITLNYCTISNVIYETSSSGTAIFATRADAGSIQTVTFTGCTIYLPSASVPIAKIIQDVSASRVTFAGKNNIFYAGASIAWGATSSTMTYSDGYQITSFPGNTGNITSDPLFVDAANGNFNLRPTSPCLNTGTLV